MKATESELPKATLMNLSKFGSAALTIAVVVLGFNPRALRSNPDNHDAIFTRRTIFRHVSEARRSLTSVLGRAKQVISRRNHDICTTEFIRASTCLAF